MAQLVRAAPPESQCRVDEGMLRDLSWQVPFGSGLGLPSIIAEGRLCNLSKAEVLPQVFVTEGCWAGERYLLSLSLSLSLLNLAQSPNVLVANVFVGAVLVDLATRGFLADHTNSWVG